MSKLVSACRRLAAAILLGSLLAGPAAASEPQLPPVLKAMLRPENPVVAIVGGQQIRWNDVIRSAANLPPAQQAQAKPLFPILLARLVDRQLLADAGRAKGYALKPEIKDAVRRYEEDLVREAYVADYLAGAVTSRAVEDRVNALADGNRTKDPALRRHVREEMSRLALDRLLAQLRSQTEIRLFP